MSEPLLAQLEEKLDLLIQRYQSLGAECKVLREHLHAWETERAALIEKNEIARARLEAMISRLKKLEAESK